MKLPFYPEYNLVSTIRIRLQKVIKCLGFLNILFWKFEQYSLSCIRGKTVDVSPISTVLTFLLVL
jgi:hypothetical protein